MSDYNPNPTFEELAQLEDETFVPESVTLRTGVGGNTAADAKRPVGEDPNAVRWAFNPSFIVDLQNKPAGSGMRFLKNVVFNKIKSLRINVGKSYGETSFDPTGPVHSAANYDAYDRTAYMIAREFEEHYGDKGVTVLTKLQGRSDDNEIAGLNALLFGEEIECVFDQSNPEHPCPVLPNLAEKLEANVTRVQSSLDPATKEVVVATARQLRDAISRAMQYARARIDDAQTRMLDEKNPNRTFSPEEQRCYLALGEEVPNVMPFLTRKASNSMQSAGAIDYEAIGRGVAAGMAVATAPAVETAAPAAPKKAQTVAVPKTALEAETTED